MVKKKLYKRIPNHNNPFPYFRTILILLLVVGLALVYVWQRISVVKYAREIQRLKDQLSSCKEEYKYLSLDVAQLGSAENIQRIVQSELDMEPYSQQISFLTEPKSSDKPASFLAKVKKTAGKVTNISENQVEAREVKHDL